MFIVGNAAGYPSTGPLVQFRSRHTLARSMWCPTRRCPCLLDMAPADTAGPHSWSVDHSHSHTWKIMDRSATVNHDRL